MYKRMVVTFPNAQGDMYDRIMNLAERKMISPTSLIKMIVVENIEKYEKVESEALE